MEPDMVALDSLLPRRTWLKLFAVLAAAQGASAVPAGPPQQQDEEAPLLITAAMLEHALALIGLEFPTEQRELMLRTVNRQLENYEILRAIEIGYDVEPAFVFNPLLPGKTPPPQASPFPDYARRPPAARSWQSVEELAFLPVEQLSALVRERRVSSSELTRMYLARLKKYSPGLLCVVNLTEELALEQAAQADREIAAGRYRGPLHGIPWGAKDLFATKGIRTTWGVAPFREQVPDHDAAVVERLGEAGAVLIAKLSMGELAMGGDWYAGATKNPWDLQQSSSGSSAGSAVAASAGLAGFTIGTETLGSIVSPSDRCGATGLRPSFGRVSRYGAMALCWTMDKIGPICRSVEDCAIVFEAIRGVDARDRSTIEAGFAWDPGQALGELRVGVLRERFDSVSDEDKPLYEQALRALQAAGAKLEDTEFPQFPGEPLRMIIEAEAAAAFDKLGREGGFEQLRGQGQGNWPNRLRSGRLIPAPEYVNMQRARMMLMRQIDEFMSGWDVLVSPPGGNVLVAGNLTGIPEVSVPCGFDASKHPKSLRFVGRLFHEGAPLRLALAFEQATNWHSMHPPLDFG